jgi:putative redox protein
VIVAKPPTTATLTWLGDLKFRASTPRTDIVLDSDGADGPTPPEAVAMSLAGCMAIDLADILVRGRHPLTALEATITGERREEPPRHFVRFILTFKVGGDVPAHAIQRAIDLSRDKYCSVWHSLRQDIQLEITYEVAPGA